MNDTKPSPLPEGVDPKALNAQIMAEIRALLGRKGMTGRELRDLVAKLTGETPSSAMWTYRRLTSGEVPLVRGPRTIPAEINSDLDMIARALGTSSDALIRKAAQNLKNGEQATRPANA
jgi:hypothetical protein